MMNAPHQRQSGGMLLPTVNHARVGGVGTPGNGLKKRLSKSKGMAYKTRKDRRKEYTGSKEFDSSCRCHGGCPWCEGSRLYKNHRRMEAADEQLRQYYRLDYMRRI